MNEIEEIKQNIRNLFSGNVNTIRSSLNFLKEHIEIKEVYDAITNRLIIPFYFPI